MFQITVISDLIRIPPHLFYLPISEAVKNELNIKYANKVIQDIGLVVSVWDLTEIQDGLIKPGDGASYVNVTFRVVVWKPFVGEILSGWIEKCSEEGIKVNLEFFNDVIIPKNYLFENSYYSKEDKAWIWQPDEETKLYLDINERINFRVEEEIFTDIKPKGPDNGNEFDQDQELKKEEKDENEDKPTSYCIIGSCQTDGMGCVAWWE